MAKTIDPELIEFLKKNDLFAGLSNKQRNLVAMQIKEIAVAANDVIIHENETNDEIYLIKKGEVKISKYDTESRQEMDLKVAGPGEVLGEISLIDGAPRSASVRAVKPTDLYVLSISSLKSLTKKVSFTRKIWSLVAKPVTQDSHAAIYTILVQNVAKSLTHRLRSTNESVVESLRNEIMHVKARAAMSQFVINVFILLSFYILVLRLIEIYKSEITSTTFISIPMLTIFAVPLAYMMQHSGYPLKTYGLTMENWRPAIKESLLYSLLIMLVTVVYKYIGIHFTNAFAGRHLFDMSLNLSSSNISVSFWYGVAIVLLYLIFVPVQELITRGALQSSFQILLTGRHKIFWSIILSNMLFSVIHVYISLAFVVIAFVPGLFWGWLYSRHHTLIGITISHLILGAWAIFIVGII